jgi:hypothetical protein
MKSGGCPIEFPIAVAQLSLDFHFGIINPLNPDGSIGLSFSSGPWYTLHADFMNGWDQARFERIVVYCLNNRLKCGKMPKPLPGG